MDSLAHAQELVYRLLEGMLKRLQGLVSAGMDFAFETTLAARSYVSFLQECQYHSYYTVNFLVRAGSS